MCTPMTSIFRKININVDSLALRSHVRDRCAGRIAVTSLQAIGWQTNSTGHTLAFLVWPK